MNATANDGLHPSPIQRLQAELKALGLAMLYFGCWLGALLLIKQLILEEYQIQFSGLSKAVVGALILSKVVLVLEHVSLGAWVRNRPAWVGVLLRTVLYALGVLVVLLLEMAFEGRHEYNGFVPSLIAVFRHADVHHVWVNTICLTGALLSYNLLSVVRRHLGDGGLTRMLTSRLPENTGGDRPDAST